MSYIINFEIFFKEQVPEEITNKIKFEKSVRKFIRSKTKDKFEFFVNSFVSNDNGIIEFEVDFTRYKYVRWYIETIMDFINLNYIDSLNDFNVRTLQVLPGLCYNLENLKTPIK